MTQQDGSTSSPQPTVAVQRVKKRRGLWQTLLLSLVIFISGGACGWGVCMLMAPRHGPGPGFMPDPPVEDIVGAMRHELLLSDQQTSQLTEIYKKRFAALKDISEQMFPKFNEQYDQLRADVQKVLTPEQFKRWSVRFDAVKNKMMPPPPPRGGPMGGPHGPGQQWQHQGPPPEGGPPFDGPPPGGPRGEGPPPQ